MNRSMASWIVASSLCEGLEYSAELPLQISWIGVLVLIFAATGLPQWTDAQASEWWASRRSAGSSNGTSLQPLAAAQS